MKQVKYHRIYECKNCGERFEGKEQTVVLELVNMVMRQVADSSTKGVMHSCHSLNTYGIGLPIGIRFLDVVS